MTEFRQSPARRASDAIFFIIMGGLSSSFIALIVLLIIADLSFTSFSEFGVALSKPEIGAAFRLTIASCTVAAILSVWVATPLGYLLSRYRFFGHRFVDTIVDALLESSDSVLSRLLGFGNVRSAIIVMNGNPILGGTVARFARYSRNSFQRAGSLVCAHCVMALNTVRIVLEIIDTKL